jgi:hypothetical protein
MTDEYEENEAGLEEIEQNLTEQERQLDQLDSFFSGLDPSIVLMVERKQPTWCKGGLEEIHVGDAQEEINLEYFITHWGGQLLSVKIRNKRGRFNKGYLIPLYSYPPLVDGRRITKADLENPLPDPAPEKSIQTQNPLVVNQGSGFDKIFETLPAIFPIISEFFKNQEIKRQNDMAMMAQLFQSQNHGGISDITKIGAVMTQLNEMFRSQNSAPIDGAGEMDFMNNALSVLQNFLGSKEQKQQPVLQNSPPPPQRHRLTPPVAPSAPVSAPNVTPIKQPVQQPMSLAQSISDLDDQSAAQAIVMALGMMPPDKRDLTIDRLQTFQESMDEDFEGQLDETEERGKR